MNLLVTVNLAHACYGIEVRDGIVRRAAPIARWMINKRWAGCEEWLRQKGAELHVKDIASDGAVPHGEVARTNEDATTAS